MSAPHRGHSLAGRSNPDFPRWLNLLGDRTHCMLAFRTVHSADSSRIDLRNTRHRRYKGRTYGTSGTYHITVSVGMPYQPLRDNIQTGKTVFDDGSQFPVQSCLNWLRQRLAVNTLGLGMRNLYQLVIGSRDLRRKGSVRDGLDLFNPLADRYRIVDDDLLGPSPAPGSENSSSISSVVRKYSGGCRSASSKPLPLRIILR